VRSPSGETVVVLCSADALLFTNKLFAEYFVFFLTKFVIVRLKICKLILVDVQFYV